MVAPAIVSGLRGGQDAGGVRGAGQRAIDTPGEVDDDRDTGILR